MSINKKIINIDFDNIDFKNEENVKKILLQLANIVELLYKENCALKEENQKLKDEINKLKGEKGKPKINANTQNNNKDNNNNNTNLGNRCGKSSKNKTKKKLKLNEIKIDDEKVVKYEGELPPDAIHKGYRSVVIQGLIIKTNNIEYKLERFYSPLIGKTFEASLPKGIEGEYDNNLKAWVISSYFDARMSEEKIYEQLNSIGIIISEGTISNIIIKHNKIFHDEKKDIIEAGIASTPYQHIDDTGARVNGNNQYFTTLCNEFYSAFFTNPKKNRFTVIDILSNDVEILYNFNNDIINYLSEKKIKLSIIEKLKTITIPSPLNLKDFEKLLKKQIPKLKQREKDRIFEACAIYFYNKKFGKNYIEQLICDDAKQFHSITPLRALCWIHEDRHYKKLIPCFDYHQKLINEFREKIWNYYDELKEYKKHPNKKDKLRLSILFDEIFSTKTGYDELDDRIVLTKNKKEFLLVVLDFPDTPLHNNPAELALRMYVIKRKISFGTRVADGTKAWETFYTILATCRKLGVNFKDYIYDRLSKKYELPSLSSLIIKNAALRYSL